MPQEEDSQRGMTMAGVLTNTCQPLKGLDKRTAWVAQESVAYGNIAPDRRKQLLAITGACSGEETLSKIDTVRHLDCGAIRRVHPFFIAIPTVLFFFRCSR